MLQNSVCMGLTVMIRKINNDVLNIIREKRTPLLQAVVAQIKEDFTQVKFGV